MAACTIRCTPPLFYPLPLKDIQGSDDPAILESLEAHGHNVAPFSLGNDHARFDNCLRGLADMPLHGMACFTPKSASIPLNNRHNAFVQWRYQPSLELLMRANV